MAAKYMDVTEVHRVNESLSRFNEEIKQVSVMGVNEEEGDLDQGAEGDIGDHLGDDSECGPADEMDIVDHSIADVIEMLIDAGYSDSDADDAVNDALSDLIDGGSIADTPDMDAEDGVKAAWVASAIPKVKTKLKELGLEFDETA